LIKVKAAQDTTTIMSRFAAGEPPPPTQSFDFHFLRTHPLSYAVTHPPFVLGVLIVVLQLYITYQHSQQRQELYAVCSQLRQTKHNTEFLMHATGDGERKIDVVSEQLEYLRERWESYGLSTAAKKAAVQGTSWARGDVPSIRSGAARVIEEVDFEDMDGAYVESGEDA
jgi:hypothetical protein